MHYRHMLETLANESGMLGVIFRKSQDKIQDPAKLRRLIELINGETWLELDIDVKGDIYEGLLQKNAERADSYNVQTVPPRTHLYMRLPPANRAPGRTGPYEKIA